MSKYYEKLWFYRGITKDINLEKQIQDCYKFIKVFFDIDRKELDKLDIIELSVLISTIILLIEMNITSKLANFGNKEENNDENKEENKGSIFDEYDKENGYVLEATKIFNRWEELKKSVYAIFRYGMEICNGTYEGCYNTSLSALIDNTSFNIENFNTSLKYKEIEAKARSIM